MTEYMDMELNLMIPYVLHFIDVCLGYYDAHSSSYMTFNMIKNKNSVFTVID